MIVTKHAIERYIQRVEAVSPEVAKERLSSPTIQMAADIGCECVKLGTGKHRVILAGHAVLTVVALNPKTTWKGVTHGRDKIVVDH
jgi:hypothetical protein